MAFVIRVAEPDRDYEKIAELRSLDRPDRVTADDIRKLDADQRPESHLLRLVGEVEGKVVAAGNTMYNIWRSPGLFGIWVCVDPDQRGKGFGDAMLVSLEDFARAKGASQFEARSSEHDSKSQAFMEKRGYASAALTFESILNLETFDPAHFEHWSTDGGVRTFSFASTEMNLDDKRRLWELNTESAQDEPTNDPDYRPSFEEFRSSVTKASWFDPHGQFIAAQGDEWIGLSAVGPMTSGTFYNHFTGVRKEHRGKGIAKALKVLAADHAKRSGAKIVKAHNDSRNAPMIAINRALGYQPQPGWIVFRKASSASK